MPLKEKTARGRNYARAEHLELAQAWGYISTVAAIGVNQSAKCFWTRVKETMEATETIATALSEDKLSARSWTSLQSLFGTISKLVSKFIRCSKKVEVTRESGTTKTDMFEKAMTLFREQHNPCFPYIDCNKILSTCPKFQKMLDKESTPGK
ncbi:hypothetical protein PF010_g9569 [Phytophthora fragariae]|uniref:No apical meristem-associated C-terminal domain-containing protein n=1 Tax=Phytophthora fragariae TaxID=53985 RepID=A0A6G0LBQ4_9STRA|nr:hypothetical protein PF010_g9569 [Phytophthora fragariae]